MSLNWLVRLAAFLFIIAVPVASRAQDPLQGWQLVQPHESGLVLIIDKIPVKSVTLSDANRTVLNTTNWPLSLPFIRQYRLVEPGTYQLVGLREPISSISVNAKAGSLTYVRLAPYFESANIVGTQIIGWVGLATSEAKELLAEAFKQGGADVLTTPHLDVPAKMLYVSTEPPWPIPPPPPPKK
jgi:hypothetical protein